MLSPHTDVKGACRFLKCGKLLLHPFLLCLQCGFFANGARMAQCRTHLFNGCGRFAYAFGERGKLIFLLVHHFLGAAKLLDLCTQGCDLAFDIGNATSLTRHFIIFSAFFKCRHSIVKATDIVDVVKQVTKLCGDAIVISLGDNGVLRKIDRARKAVGINAKQLLANARGITVTFAVGGKIV